MWTFSWFTATWFSFTHHLEVSPPTITGTNSIFFLSLIFQTECTTFLWLAHAIVLCCSSSWPLLLPCVMLLKSLITLLDTAKTANKRILQAQTAMILWQLHALSPLLCQSQHMFAATPVVSNTSIFHFSKLCFTVF